MNVLRKMRWFLASRIYPSSDVIGYLVSSFIDEGKLIKETEYYATIEYKNNVYNVWIENYPYAWLSKCNYTSKENYELRYKTWETVWKETVPPKEVAMRFEDWLYKERKRLFDEQNFIEETDNTHQTQLKETAMSNETSCEFKPFDKVLVRDNDTEEWMAAFYSHYDRHTDDGEPSSYPHRTLGGMYRQCIHWEGNESLLKTSNKPEGCSVNMFHEGDAVEFIRMRDDKWVKGVIGCIDPSHDRTFCYRIDYKEDGSKDYMWCSEDQLREACVNECDDKCSDEDKFEEPELEFDVDDKIWYKGQFSDNKWMCGTVVQVDKHDPNLPYRISLFAPNSSWWVNAGELKPIDDNPF